MLLQRLFYYLSSVPTLLLGVRNWPKMIALFAGLPIPRPFIIQLKDGSRFLVRTPMDVWIIKETCLDRQYEQASVRIEEDWTVIDIGAGLGDFTIYAARRCIKDIVYAYEPFPESFFLLQENLRLNHIQNVRPFLYAVGAQAGYTDLYVASGEAVQYSTACRASKPHEAFRVPVLSLDQVLSEIQSPVCDYLKVDCEGAEYEIFFHASDLTLRRIRHICLEYHDGVTDFSHWDLVRFFEEKGFQVSLTPNPAWHHLGFLYAVNPTLAGLGWGPPADAGGAHRACVERGLQPGRGDGGLGVWGWDRSAVGGAAMSVSLFHRSPRSVPLPPTEEVEIQPPPSAPARPTSSLLAVLAPLGMTVLAFGLSVAFAATNPTLLLFSLPMMLGSGLIGLITYSGERSKYRRAVEKRERDYRAYLAGKRQELEALAARQRQASLEPNPDLQTCLARARRTSAEHARHLWERSSGLERPRDPDFLHLRLGLGRLPAAFRIKPPSRPAVGEEDELYQEAFRLCQAYAHLDGLAIPLPLAQIGAAGIAGPRPLVRDLTRALLVQMTAHHAPSEVRLVALLPQQELDEWVWVRWLPHIWDEERKRRFIAAAPDEARALLSDLHALLQRRALGRAPDETTVYPQTYLFLFADPALFTTADTAGLGPALRLLLTQGAAVGAYSLFLADRPESLPSACGAVVDLSGGGGLLRLTGAAAGEIPFTPDRVDAAWADAFARALAPIRLKPLAGEADIPSNVPLTALLQAPRLEDYSILQHWQARDSHIRLEVPLGIEKGGGITYLNFQDAAQGGDGSHAMVGGTTGTGKTRFLQTMVALLAAHHHPHDVNFLLIDYKGGDLLKGLEDLPHVVGTLANLEKADAQAVLVERLFVCLEAELLRRRNLLGGRNINAYQRDLQQGRETEPLPHLFVVIDEFAEMIRNSPDKAAMTKRLLSIGATGRSLGVHLVLATQDPAGVVTDELRNNINIRLCLRMGSREASMALLRLPDAFENITTAQVGRAILQVGNNDRFAPFQVAWGGDRYTPGQAALPVGEIYQVGLDGRRVPLRRFHPLQAAEETQLSAIVRHIRTTADRLGLPRLRSPISPPLRDTIFLDELRAGKPGWDGQAWKAQPGAPWLAPIIGQADDPAGQAQPLLRLRLGAEGHFALFGKPGSGKTTFLQTLVTSLALDHSPEEVHIYLIDFSSQRLLPLKGFPHVGDVFLGDEVDRLQRFFRFLSRELQARKAEFTRAGATRLPDYRTLSGKSLPAIVVILRDYDAFYKACQDRNLDLDHTLVELARDGGSYGLHFVLTMTAPSELRSRLATAISMAATFHLATPDYGMAVGPTGGMTPAPLPGRGLFKGPPLLEFQTAIPARGNTDPERTLALRALMEAMERAWAGARPRAFPPVPAVVGLSQILFPADRWITPPPAGRRALFAINLEDPDQPFEVDLRDGPYFLAAGTAGSGRTTLLQSWLLALAERYPPSRLLFYLVDLRQSGLLALSDLPHVRAPVSPKKGGQAAERETGVITDDDRFAQALAEIDAALMVRQPALEEARRQGRGAFRLDAWLDPQPTLLLVIDDLDIFETEIQPASKDLLNAGLKRWRDLGFALIAAGNITDIENAWGWVAQLRNTPVGFQLGTAAYNQVFKVNLPSVHPAKLLAPGEAFYVRRGQFLRVKIADPQVGPVKLEDWAERLSKRVEE